MSQKRLFRQLPKYRSPNCDRGAQIPKVVWAAFPNAHGLLRWLGNHTLIQKLKCHYIAMDATPKRTAAVGWNTCIVVAAKLLFTAWEFVSWVTAGTSTRIYARLVYLDSTHTKRHCCCPRGWKAVEPSTDLAQLATNMPSESIYKFSQSNSRQLLQTWEEIL